MPDKRKRGKQPADAGEKQEKVKGKKPRVIHVDDEKDELEQAKEADASQEPPAVGRKAEPRSKAANGKSKAEKQTSKRSKRNAAPEDGGKAAEDRTTFVFGDLAFNVRMKVSFNDRRRRRSGTCAACKRSTTSGYKVIKSWGTGHGIAWAASCGWARRMEGHLRGIRLADFANLRLDYIGDIHKQ